jgi:hypothetical protein
LHPQSLLKHGLREASNSLVAQKKIQARIISVSSQQNFQTWPRNFLASPTILRPGWCASLMGRGDICLEISWTVIFDQNYYAIVIFRVGGIYTPSSPRSRSWLQLLSLLNHSKLQMLSISLPSQPIFMPF